MNPQVPIKEKFSGPWRVIWLFIIIIFGLMLLVSALLRNLEAIEGLVWVIALASAYVAIFQRVSRGQRPKWFMAGDGIIRVYASRESELITWEQMEDMKYVAGFGLIIQWNKSQPSSRAKPVYEVVRSNLGVDQEEADRLLSAWRSCKTDTSVGQMNQQQFSRTSSYKLQGGKLIFAGILGLVAFVAEARNKNWPAAGLLAVIALAVLVLGFRWTRKSR